MNKYSTSRNKALRWGSPVTHHMKVFSFDFGNVPSCRGDGVRTGDQAQCWLRLATSLTDSGKEATLEGLYLRPFNVQGDKIRCHSYPIRDVIRTHRLDSSRTLIAASIRCP